MAEFHLHRNVHLPFVTTPCGRRQEQKRGLQNGGVRGHADVFLDQIEQRYSTGLGQTAS